MDGKGRIRFLVVSTLLIWVISLLIFGALLLRFVHVQLVVIHPEQAWPLAFFISFTLLALSSASLLLARLLGREQQRVSALERELQAGSAKMDHSQRTLDTLLGDAHSTILIFDKFGKAAYVNPAHERILGYSPEEYKEDPELGDRIVVPEDREKRKEYFDQVSSLDVPTEPVMIRYHNRSGDLIYLEYHASAILSRIAEPIGVLVIGRDITKQREVEQKLRESEEVYRSLTNDVLDSSEVGMFILDRAFRVVWVNRALERFLGLRRDNIIGKDKRQLIRERIKSIFEEPEAFAEKVLATYDDNTYIEKFECHVLADKERKERWLEHWSQPIRSGLYSGGRIEHYTDVTERKRMEEQLRLAQKMEAIGRLAGGIAHDFNNLLTAINGYSALILERLDWDDPVRKDIEVINNAGERAAALTRQLLAFSRKQVLEPEVIDLNSVVADMDKILRRVIGEDIDLVTVLQPKLAPVKVDPAQVEQIILNLAVNARDAMPDGGKVTIETSNVELDEEYAKHHVSATPGSYVMLAVSDAGVGMDAETQKRIFEPFFTTKKGEGTGLGLSTVYGIVKQSGGNIWVYSEPGQGTTFKIYLPRVKEPANARTPERVSVESLRGSEKILLVEDEAAVRKLVREILEKYGYTVLDAYSGREALSLAERHRHPIHLMMTDVVLPDMHGPELARRLTSLRPETRILYSSGYTDNAIVHRGVLEAGTAFLQKPFTPQTLARKVREVLDETRADSSGRRGLSNTMDGAGS